jgi:hypothetical protein
VTARSGGGVAGSAGRDGLARHAPRRLWIRGCILLLYPLPGCSNYGSDLWSYGDSKPRTSCVPSRGRTSVRVRSRRSPSRSVRPGPTGSGWFAVLSCCTSSSFGVRCAHHLGPQPSAAPCDTSPDRRLLPQFRAGALTRSARDSRWVRSAAALNAILAGFESPHLFLCGQHRDTQEGAVRPFKVTATGIVPQSRLRSRQRPVEVHRVNHVHDLWILHLARHRTTLSPGYEPTKPTVSVMSDKFSGWDVWPCPEPHMAA